MALDAGAVLAGRSVVGAVTGAGTIRPGDQALADPATLRCSSLDLAEGVLGIDLAAAGDDLLVVDGDATLGGSIALDLAGEVPDGSHTILTCGGVLTVHRLRLTGVPAGRTAVLDLGTPGEIRIIVGHGDWRRSVEIGIDGLASDLDYHQIPTPAPQGWSDNQVLHRIDGLDPQRDGLFNLAPAAPDAVH